MVPFKILFVDDEEINLLNFKMIFQDRYEIITAVSGEEGLEIFKKTDDIGLVISDQRMPGISGVEMLSKIYEIDPDPIRVLLTAHSQIEYVLDAINRGQIYQYILKPWDTNELNRIIDRAKNLYQLTKLNISLTQELAEKNKNLEVANEQLRLSEIRLGDLSAMLITAQDDERRRISMELHDEFGQSLAALKMQLRGMENKIYDDNGYDSDAIVEDLRALRQYVNIQIENVRNLSRELWPMLVDHLGVDAAFDNLISTFLGQTEIDIDLRMEAVGQFFSIEEQRHLYRLLQESLNNVIKHAEARSVKIVTHQVEDYIILAIHDDGVGFDTDAVSKYTGTARGMGLQSMYERVKLLKGKMEIRSKPSHGTSLVFTIALRKERP